MARKYRTGADPTGYAILVVDDDEAFRRSTCSLLEAQGHHVLRADGGVEALATLEREPVDVVLLDYVMPGMNGDEIVRRIRERDELVRIILVTGYTGERPAREMMRELDVQGYHDKTDGADRLLLWLDAALNTYGHIRAVERFSDRLQRVLDAAPSLYRIQSLETLLGNLVRHTQALLDAESSFLATLPRERISATTRGLFDDVEIFVALDGPEFRDVPLEVRYGTGRFHEGTALDELPEPERSMVWAALRRGEVQADASRSIVPLRLGDRTVGVIFISRGIDDRRDRTVLEIFASQAAAALHNTVLFEGATVDSLTGALRRGFTLQRLQQSLKDVRRRGEPLSLLMIDVDHFKRVNDSFGHYVGDRVLATIAHILQRCTRETDFVGRIGGDEFLVVLPGTPAEGAQIVAERILAQAAETRLLADGGEVGFHLSIGSSSLAEGPEMQSRVPTHEFACAVEVLMRRADDAMYAGKHTGRAGAAPPLAWAEMVSPPIVAMPAAG